MNSIGILLYFLHMRMHITCTYIIIIRIHTHNTYLHIRTHDSESRGQEEAAVDDD